MCSCQVARKSFARDDGVARKYVAMNLRQIWEFTQEAQEKNMSLQTLAKAKSKDAACGISSNLHLPLDSQTAEDVPPEGADGVHAH